jgi:hypothetical protein
VLFVSRPEQTTSLTSRKPRLPGDAADSRQSPLEFRPLNRGEQQKLEGSEGPLDLGQRVIDGEADAGEEVGLGRLGCVKYLLLPTLCFIIRSSRRFNSLYIFLGTFSASSTVEAHLASSVWGILAPDLI